jgi:hypothetical protein
VGKNDRERAMPDADWSSYEDVAVYLLNAIANELGLDVVEGKQIVPGKTGARWEIDGKGVRDRDGAFVVIECRRYTTSKVKQEQAGGLAYRIGDTGAGGGIFVTPLGLQKGAEKVAAASGIQTVLLSEDSTTTDYILQFLNRIFVGASDSARISDNAQVTILKTDVTE